MSPTYLKLFLAMLGLFSIATSALPADPESITISLQDPPTTSSIALPSPTIPTCAGSNTEFTCPVSNDTHYVAHDCQDFVIECGTDRTGGDLPNSPQYPGSFLGCVDACASDEACVALVYTDGPCYLKGELVATVELPGATGARKATALVSATETSFLEAPVVTSSVWAEPEPWTTSLSAPIVVTTSVVFSVASSVAVATVTTTILGVSSLGI
ncbi:hypothetical protein DBV05_g5950 [Lasiodiplodia theobromae]|uniref:Apple domain-containing protein n=1 Tax=Lasiodiplodia theobromae TaxID=45133 RepID=A0A5N5DDE9_9PEZI|nr:hypothetical protein DBV05_g5950 [Lasiodiplodia theobromae]